MDGALRVEIDKAAAINAWEGFRTHHDRAA